MKKLFAAMLVALFAVTLVAAPVALAQNGNGNGGGEFQFNPDDPFGTGVVSDNLELSDQDIRVTVSNIINSALGILGIVAVVIILAGGFRWMTAGGNEEQVSQARQLIGAGVIGLVIIISAWGIARFVLSVLESASGS